jgi:AraC-like DNA-binding protein
MSDALSSLEYFPSVLHAEEETQSTAAYCWDNRDRVPTGTIVIQRTIAGCAILEGPQGGQPVGVDQAMLFSYGEKTAYRIGEPETWPYVLSYVVLGPRGGIGDLVRQIRQDFGDVIQMAETGDAARHLSTLASCFRREEKPDLLMLAELAYQFLIAVYREQVSGTAGTDPVAYLRHLLRSQFRAQRTIKEWIHELPISREHLTRKFHQRYRETPAAYLRRLRLDYARLLAQSSSMDAGEIALASGFVSAQTLRRAFRKEYGESLGSL